MHERTLNMTQGSPTALLVRFALPLMVGNMFQQLYTVVDTAIVGKALGVDALAALGAADWLNWMMLGIIQGLTQGFGILMAQHYGANRMNDLRRVIGSALILSAFGAAVLVLLGQGLVTPVLTLLKTPADIIGGSKLYLRIMFAGLPIVMAYNLFACILRSMGDGSTPLYAMIAASLVNIVLDLLFVLGFHWGIAGAAIATLIAQAVSSLYCLLRIRKMDSVILQKDDFRVEWKLSFRLLMLGFPMAFQNAIIAVGGMILQLVVNGFGVIFIAGYTATNKLFGLLEVAATSYGYALVTYTGQNLGAGKVSRIRQGVRSANLIAFLTAAAIAAIMIVFGKPIVSLFLSGDPGEVSQAMKIAYRYLVTMSLCLPLLYYLHVTRSTIQGVGNTVLPMVSGVVEFIMRTGCVFVLPALLGSDGVFAAEVSAWLGADVVLAASYLFITQKISHTAE